MKPKKPAKATKRDTAQQKKIEKKVIAEKVKLGHPNGAERFISALKNSIKK